MPNLHREVKFSAQSPLISMKAGELVKLTENGTLISAHYAL
jgi:hypothetical protein